MTSFFLVTKFIYFKSHVIMILFASAQIVQCHSQMIENCLSLFSIMFKSIFDKLLSSLFIVTMTCSFVRHAHCLPIPDSFIDYYISLKAYLSSLPSLSKCSIPFNSDNPITECLKTNDNNFPNIGCFLFPPTM